MVARRATRRARRRARRVRHALAELDRGRSAAVELVGEPGIGKTRLLAELAARADARGLSRALGLGLGARARPAVLGVRRRARRVRRRASSPRRLDALDDDVRGELAHVFPSLVELRGAGRDARSSTSATGATAPCASCSSCSRRRRPLVLVLDDLHWADSGVGRAARRAAAPAARRRRAARARGPPAPDAGAARRRARARAPRRDARPPRARRAHARRGRRAPRRQRSTAPQAAALYEESGGNPFYLEQLARRSIAGPSGAAAAPEHLARRRRGPADRRGRAGRGARAALGRARASCSRAPRSPAIRSSPSSPRPPPATTRGGGDRGARRAAAARPRARDRRAAALPLPAPARPPRGLRVDARRLAAGRARAQRRGARGARRLGVGARPPRRALRAPAATPPRSRSCARPARQPRSARRRAPRAGSQLRCGSSPTTRRPRSGSSCCWRAPERWPRPASSPRATPRCSRASRSCPSESIALRVRLTVACAGVEHLLGRHEQAHARLESALAELPDPRLARGASR